MPCVSELASCTTVAGMSALSGVVGRCWGAPARFIIEVHKLHFHQVASWHLHGTVLSGLLTPETCFFPPSRSWRLPLRRSRRLDWRLLCSKLASLGPPQLWTVNRMSKGSTSALLVPACLWKIGSMDRRQPVASCGGSSRPVKKGTGRCRGIRESSLQHGHKTLRRGCSSDWPR